MDRRELIDKYANGGEKLAQSIRGLTESDLDSFPVPGTWSIHQIVVHVMDSDLISTDRMKRMIAEENPSLLGYDESKFAQNLHYHDQPANEAVAIVGANRRLFANVLRKLPPEAFDRAGTHNERGRLTLGDYLKAVTDHLEHHLKFIYDKRERLGKLMW
jgi:uncharacterized damage-inducible protein DinB